MKSVRIAQLYLSTRENSVVYNYEGKKYTLAQAAKEFGISRNTLCGRIYKMNMTFEEAILFDNPKFIDWEKLKWE